MKNPNSWEVYKLSKPQPRPYYVARLILMDTSNTHYEQMRDETGATARFESEAEALAMRDALAVVAAERVEV